MHKIISELTEKGSEFVLATIVRSSAGSPGRSGFKLIYTHDKIEGTVGGGELEKRVIAMCQKVVKTRENYLYELNLAAIGMECGGDVAVFIEHYPGARTAWLMGGGHICSSLLPLLNSIGFRVNIFDNRPDICQKPDFVAAAQVACGDYVDFCSNFQPGPDDAVLIFTHGHAYDRDILATLTMRDIDIKYLGMIGSAKKIKKIIASLDISDSLTKKLYSPIGLNVATGTTSEIAISIVAEVLAVYNGVTKPAFMREKLKIV